MNASAVSLRNYLNASAVSLSSLKIFSLSKVEAGEEVGWGGDSEECGERGRGGVCVWGM